MKGVDTDNLISVALSTVYAFILAIPFALLFERGGNSIWGVALVHFAVDSNNYFPIFSELGAPLAVYLLVGVAGCLGVIAWMARRSPAPQTP